MEPLNLLIVAIRTEWKFLISDSLQKAGYTFTETHVSSKQEALEACNYSRYDLVISNCRLPDGDVADLVSVIGKLFPCLVMAEGKCPVNSEKALSLLATDFYITSSEQSSWISAVENALSQWKKNAQQNLREQRLKHSTLHKKVLTRVEEELSSEEEYEHSDSKISSVLTLLLEVLDLSRIYLCAKQSPSEGEPTLLGKTEIVAPGVKKVTYKDASVSVPYFNRWNTIFSAKQPVTGTLTTLPPGEQQWLNYRDSQSLLAVPILSDDNWEGFIGLEDSFNAREWSTEEINLIESVAELIKDKHFQQTPTPYFFEGNMVSAQV
ncbi:hypothetical protein DYBT9275_02015 [Dyadobacter sp. CECT 9275]|uniref:GAF domain-containing protein n=1 Tax=Dyadobacter helix TaxID=2822344 RepID=A0A916NBJ9_9BACT|nr:GAF domain-containing protein [Dyadobacter sp. CECT 9275]CAG4998512.1 hypothetical protein DYBT9275_02015 [Dyadobacter sp. CECT 9275]